MLTCPRYETIYAELVAIRAAAPHPTLIKLILETSQLSDQQIIAGAVLASAAGLDFIKTASGFHGHGATCRFLTAITQQSCTSAANISQCLMSV